MVQLHFQADRARGNHGFDRLLHVWVIILLLQHAHDFVRGSMSIEWTIVVSVNHVPKEALGKVESRVVVLCPAVAPEVVYQRLMC